VPTFAIGNPFGMLKQEVDEIQEECDDVYADQFEVAFDHKGFVLKFRECDTDTIHQAHFSEYSFSQLCTKLGIPVRYMQKCITEKQRPLVLHNINTWLSTLNKTLLIRKYGANVRGILSDRFSVLDTPDVLQVLMDSVDTSVYKLKGSVVNEERFHARFISLDPLGVDDLFPGIQIDTSDVGRSTLTIKFLLFKQVCTNGLVIAKFGGEIFSQKHIGISSETFRKELVANMEQFPQIAKKVKELVIYNKHDLLTPSDLSVGDKLFGVLKTFKNTTGVSDKIIEQVAERTPVYGMNRWGMINAITEVAQQYTLDRRLQLEEFASNLLLVA
jgi:hypothetical protein